MPEGEYPDRVCHPSPGCQLSNRTARTAAWCMAAADTRAPDPTCPSRHAARVDLAATGFPFYPIGPVRPGRPARPDQGLPVSPGRPARPDQGLPGSPPAPDQGLPPGSPGAPDRGLPPGSPGSPQHPIATPPIKFWIVAGIPGYGWRYVCVEPFPEHPIDPVPTP